MCYDTCFGSLNINCIKIRLSQKWCLKTLILFYLTNCHTITGIIIITIQYCVDSLFMNYFFIDSFKCTTKCSYQYLPILITTWENFPFQCTCYIIIKILQLNNCYNYYYYFFLSLERRNFSSSDHQDFNDISRNSANYELLVNYILLLYNYYDCIMYT